jgi:hypothetical protein
MAKSNADRGKSVYGKKIESRVFNMSLNKRWFTYDNNHNILIDLYLLMT